MTRPVLASALLLVAACQDPTAPQEPVWGKQACAHCRMVLSDPAHAAQLSTDDGRRLFFDDVGCMAAELNAGELAVKRAWVRDGARWSDAFAVRYAPGAQTPMGFGFAVSGAGALDFAGLKRAVAERISQGGRP